MQLRIKAVEGQFVMLVDAIGRVRPGRFAGYDAQRNALPDGELVDDHDHYRRQARRVDAAGRPGLIVEEVTP